MLVLTFVCEFNQWQWIRNTLIVLTWNIQHTFFLCKIFDRESRKKETVGKEDNSRNSEAIEKQMGTIMGGCWVICVCVCGWSGDSAGAKKKKKPKDSLRVNLFTIVVVFVIVNIVVVVLLLIQDNFWVTVPTMLCTFSIFFDHSVFNFNIFCKFQDLGEVEKHKRTSYIVNFVKCFRNI